MDFRRFISRDFWNVKEIGYQVVHMTLGFTASYAVFHQTGMRAPGVAAALAIGLLIEFEQRFRLRNDGTTESLRLEDRIRDVFFWFVGGLGVFIE